MISIEIGKVNVACSEVVFVDTIISQDIEACILCIFCGREYSQRLITVECVSHLTNLSANSSTIYLAIHILDIVSQFGYLVLVVAKATA